LKVCFHFILFKITLILLRHPQIDPIRRHVDKSVVAHFWKILDMWMMSNKPWLIKA